MHVLVHVRLRHYCHLPRHPAMFNWRADLSFSVCYANLCGNLQLAATVHAADSKSAGPCGRGVRSPLCRGGLNNGEKDSVWIIIGDSARISESSSKFSVRL